MGRDRSALTLLRRLVAEHPADPSVRCHLALALLRSGASREALKEADAALAHATAPDEAWAHQLRGAALLRCGQPDAAASALREALARDPRNAGVLCELAVAECAIGSATTALDHASEAARLQPRAAAPHNAVALALLALQRWPEADAAARRALELNHGDVQASNNLALALLAQGNQIEARTFLRTALMHSEVMRSAHGVVARNQRLLGGDSVRGSFRRMALSGQMLLLVFLGMFVVVAFLRSPLAVPVAVVAAALLLRPVVFRSAGGGAVRARRLQALPATSRVTVARPPRR